MEIQGLSDAQNIHSQHGALHRTVPSPLRSATGSIPRFICTENEADGQLGSPDLQSDDNNNNTRPRTSPFRLLAENGSETSLSAVKAQAADRTGSRPTAGIHNVNTEKENEVGALLGSRESLRTVWKCGAESGGSLVQMALPLFEGEEEATQRRQRQPGHRCAAAAGGSFGTATREVGVVLDGGRENVDGGAARAATAGSPEGYGQIKGKKADACGSMEVGNRSNIILCESHHSFNGVDAESLKKAEHEFGLLNDHLAGVNFKQTPGHHTVEDVVLTNKYGDKICGQICTENDEATLVGEFSSQSDDSSVLISETSRIVEAMDTADFISDSSGLQDIASRAAASTSPPSSETFSGTITINNQSIIVTIENGILTLAAPQEGYVHKEDDMVSLKEHLGMKDHEDIVLLNYDSGTKSIGKISTLAVSSTSQHDEPRPAICVSDSELGLVDDCSLSELGTSLDSCPIIKQEVEELCAVTEASLDHARPKATAADCASEDLPSAALVRSKKEPVASFECPDPGCSGSFNTRQKLKVHLLNHAEDPRPYQCTVEGCGWAFVTSYKLKRHLQSHDKQRPHACHFEGCGRRFTTVYNLKAHIKVHEQDNSFICEICSERFRSATRLTNHQRVHFEPQRPHKCEFPGSSTSVFSSITKYFLYSYSTCCWSDLAPACAPHILLPFQVTVLPPYSLETTASELFNRP